MTKHLIIDATNILFRVAAVNKDKIFNAEDLAGMCMHVAIMSANKLFKQFKPDKVVFAFEGGNNWRKKFTETTKSGVKYKANRVPDKSMEHLYELIKDFKDVMHNYTSTICLAIPGLEGDDVIAGYVQLYSSENDTMYIVSADKDFVQLLKYPNTYLLDPNTGGFRNQPGHKDYCEDIDYFMFLKCVRGDGGDNVPSAFPKVRETRIKKAFSDPIERINFMNETWILKETIDDTVVEKEMVVGELFKENEILMDLSKQPDDIRQHMLVEIVKIVEDPGKYNNFKMIQFLGKHNLKNILDNIGKYVELFSCGQQNRVRVEDTESIITFD
jgi:5'-3' exonuclease